MFCSAQMQIIRFEIKQSRETFINTIELNVDIVLEQSCYLWL